MYIVNKNMQCGQFCLTNITLKLYADIVALYGRGRELFQTTHLIFLWCWTCEFSCYITGVNRFVLLHRVHFSYCARKLFSATRFTVVIWPFSSLSSLGHVIHCLHSAACYSYSIVIFFLQKNENCPYLLYICGRSEGNRRISMWKITSDCGIVYHKKPVLLLFY